ncbi:2OG-Fe(II) oxygenase [Endothiovibrio diazotrophicus]
MPHTADSAALAHEFAPLLDDLLRQGWSYLPEFLAPEPTTALREEALDQWQTGCFRHAAVGRDDARQVLPEVRGDSIHWLDTQSAAPAQRDYLARMERLRLAVNRTLYLGLERFEVHAARYPAGRGYQRHLDRFKGSEERRLTCVLYLNDDWREEHGGQLRLSTATGAQDLLPRGGALAAFITEGMWHEVLPAKRPRLAMTGWFRRDERIL